MMTLLVDSSFSHAPNGAGARPLLVAVQQLTNEKGVLASARPWPERGAFGGAPRPLKVIAERTELSLSGDMRKEAPPA
jgi:hypothetical protein